MTSNTSLENINSSMLFKIFGMLRVSEILNTVRGCRELHEHKIRNRWFFFDLFIDRYLYPVDADRIKRYIRDCEFSQVKIPMCKGYPPYIPGYDYEDDGYSWEEQLDDYKDSYYQTIDVLIDMIEDENKKYFGQFEEPY